MAHRLFAIAKYHPRIELENIVQTVELSPCSADPTILNDGSDEQFLDNPVTKLLLFSTVSRKAWDLAGDCV